MFIVCKYIAKNMLEKKFRTFIIIFSITISAALFFASIAISNTMSDMIVKQLRQYCGDSDIIIRPGSKSPTPFFSKAGLEKMQDRTIYSIGAIEGSARYISDNYNNTSINFISMNFDEIAKMNPIALEKQEDTNSFTGNRIIISKYTAEKYQLTIGDMMKFKIGDYIKEFRIYAISYPAGIFKDESQKIFAILPFDTVSKIFNTNGKYNIMFVKAGDINDKDFIIKGLMESYKNYYVTESISQDEINQNAGSISTTFLLMTIIVAFMSIFIIYSSFKVITFERISILGIFRSIGASKKATNMVLVIESLFYGVVGGVFGCISGIGILYVMSYIITPDWQKIEGITINYNIFQLILALLLAVGLAFISSIFSIVKISKIPVKEILVNKLDSVKSAERGVFKFLLAICLLILAVIIPRIIPFEYALISDIICTLVAISSVVLLVPYFSIVLVNIVDLVFSLFFGNVGVLAKRNVKSDKNIITNISLLCVAIASILMIVILTRSALEEMTNYYSKTPNFDIMAIVDNMDENFEKKVYSLGDVKYAGCTYSARDIEVRGKSEGITQIEGTYGDEIFKYWNLLIYGDKKKIISELGNGRNIVLNVMLKDRYKVDIGDDIVLKMKKGYRNYKVIGFMNTSIEAGSYGIVPEKYLKLDNDFVYYNTIYIKTGIDPYMFEKKFKKEFSQRGAMSITMKEIAKNDFEKSKQQFAILIGFSVLSMLIGIMSIMNNLIVSFIQRRRLIAVFRSIGMSSMQVAKMVFIESFYGGVIGGLLGLSGGLIMVSIVPYLLRALYLRSVIHYEILVFILCFSAGVLVNILASISPMLKSSRLNIIESIKME